jgi:hypothetical protein
MRRAGGEVWINSFAHGRSVYDADQLLQLQERHAGVVPQLAARIGSVAFGAGGGVRVPPLPG